MEKKYSPRKYHFELPYQIPASYIKMGLNRFKKDGTFQRLPKYMQRKLQKAYDNWWSLTVYEKDLNSIDDQTWTHLSFKLKLKWSYV